MFLRLCESKLAFTLSLVRCLFVSILPVLVFTTKDEATPCSLWVRQRGLSQDVISQLCWSLLPEVTCSSCRPQGRWCRRKYGVTSKKDYAIGWQNDACDILCTSASPSATSFANFVIKRRPLYDAVWIRKRHIWRLRGSIQANPISLTNKEF